MKIWMEEGMETFFARGIILVGAFLMAGIPIWLSRIPGAAERPYSAELHIRDKAYIDIVYVEPKYVVQAEHSCIGREFGPTFYVYTIPRFVADEYTDFYIPMMYSKISDVICECTTADGVEVWGSIDRYQYDEFIERGQRESNDQFFPPLSFPEPTRIHGHIINVSYIKNLPSELGNRMFSYDSFDENESS